MRALFLCCIAAILYGCSYKGFIGLHDNQYFSEHPEILCSGERFFLRFRYATEHPCYFMMTESRIKNDTLVFRISATSSSGNLQGRVQLEEIKSEEKILLIRNANVYWESEGNIQPINVRKGNHAAEPKASSRMCTEIISSS